MGLELVPTGDNRPPAYYEEINGKTVLVIRASAIGHSCLWELIAAGQGIEPSPIPDWLQRAFDEGNAAEPVIIERLISDHQFTFLSQQDEGELWLSDDVLIRFHPDGIANLSSGFIMEYLSKYAKDSSIPLRTVVVEIKALSDSLWQTAKSKSVGNTIDEYQWQLSVMMHETGLPGLWVALNKGGPVGENGLRELTPDTGKLLFELVREPPVSIEEIQLKASLIKQGVEDEDILTSDRKCGDLNHFPCHYLHLRPEPEPGEAEDDHLVRVDDQDEINTLVRDYVFHKGQVDEAQSRVDEAKRKIIHYANQHPKAKRLITDRWRVPVVRGSQTYIAVEEMDPTDKQIYEALQFKYKRKKSKAPFLTKIKRVDL